MKPKRILLLGSGELGKEFTIAAQRLGQYVIAIDSYSGAPAMQVADEHHVINMLDADQLNHVIGITYPDIIVPEIEAIRTEVLYDWEEKGIQVVPSAKAVNYTMNRKTIRDFAVSRGIRTARFKYAYSSKELKDAAEEIGLPCVVKPLMSSSGHGQSIIREDADIEKAWQAATNGARGDVSGVIVEEFIKFDYEVTLLAITQKNGKTLYLPPIEHVQKAGDYRESWIPSKAYNKENVMEQLQNDAFVITKGLTGYGIWGVEFFVMPNGTVIFSELSPRPHDTGMVTLSNCVQFNEFEFHLRAILGLPIAEDSVCLGTHAASAVILSPAELDGQLDYNIETVAAASATDFRIFGKPVAHPGRRMGVVVCRGYDETDMLRYKAKYLASTVLGTDPYTTFSH